MSMRASSGDSGGTLTDQWVSEAYLRIPTLRTQAVLDLLTRVQHPEPRLVVDLGCGPGNNTELIAEHWPKTRVIGVDSSPNMIAAAREREQPGHLEFHLGDLATWQPDEPVDVILFNAVLQWVPGHAALMPRFAAMLAPGGVLGFQMPGLMPGTRANDPLLETILELTREPQWRDKLGRAFGDETLLDSIGYIGALADAGLIAEAWETRYTYLLAGTGRLVEYVSGSILRPVFALLSPPEGEQFRAEFAQRVSEVHPPRVIGGETAEVLSQRRIFAVGRTRN
jgi:trans-aconitate 2-methyltransferase